jgi:ribosomal protein L16 Arg81 hydroxylase
VNGYFSKVNAIGPDPGTVLTPELFLLEHWQKAPLLMRGALKLPGATERMEIPDNG